jgi:hypothetical protein
VVVEKREISVGPEVLRNEVILVNEGLPSCMAEAFGRTECRGVDDEGLRSGGGAEPLEGYETIYDSLCISLRGPLLIIVPLLHHNHRYLMLKPLSLAGMPWQ